jgi:hypothetical protein
MSLDWARSAVKNKTPLERGKKVVQVLTVEGAD